MFKVWYSYKQQASKKSTTDNRQRTFKTTGGWMDRSVNPFCEYLPSAPGKLLTAFNHTPSFTKKSTYHSPFTYLSTVIRKSCWKIPFESSTKWWPKSRRFPKSSWTDPKDPKSGLTSSPDMNRPCPPHGRFFLLPALETGLSGAGPPLNCCAVIARDFRLQHVASYRPHRVSENPYPTKGFLNPIWPNML